MSALAIFIACFVIGRFIPSIAGLALIIGTAIAAELLLGNRALQGAILLAISVCSLLFAHRMHMLMQWREGMRLAGYIFALLAVLRWAIEGWQAALPILLVAGAFIALTQLGRWLEHRGFNQTDNEGAVGQ
jgi:hypothetical protein